ncbi:MAG: tyrosine-type recombinase/integrase [Bacilli bacterium]|nr:tyrosine-type recombinase/integrase [Bacilli bacterium]
MKLSEAINEAKKTFYDLKFTESTVERKYGYIWKRMLKNSLDDVLSKESIIKHFINYYGLDYFNTDNRDLTKHEIMIKNVFYCLLEFIETKMIKTKPMSAHDKPLIHSSANALEKYLLIQSKIGLKQRTISNKKNIITRFLYNYPLENLSKTQIFKYIESQSNRNNYAARLDINIIKSFLIYSYENNFINFQPKKLFPTHIVSSNNNVPSYYTPEELKKVINHAKQSLFPNNKRDYAILSLIISTGLRAKDVCELQYSHINWNENTITLTTSKTGRTTTLPLLADTGNAIIEYLIHYRSTSNVSNIFVSKNGTELYSSNITGIINKLFIDSKINLKGRKFGPHSLRSSLASNMLSQEVPIFTISKTLSHISVQTTKHYIKIDVNNLKKCHLEVPNGI